MADNTVAGELYESLTGQLFEIGRQLRQPTGYPFDPKGLKNHLQAAIEGRFVGSACSWREENGVIRFSVTSDGTIGPNWIPRLESKGFRAGDQAKFVLRSPSFVPTTGITTEVAVLPGKLFTDSNRITKQIRKEAYAGTFTGGQKLSDPHAEVACLIREMFTDEEIEAMGLWGIVAMHQPFKGSGGDPLLLGADRDGDGRWLCAYCDSPVSRWGVDVGFAFVVPQVGA